MTISRALARPLSRPLKRNLYSSTSNLTPAFSLFSGATLSPLVTFTRASSATYFDSAGVMQTAATNAPRIDYDPVSLAFKGLLVEEARTNLLLYSGDASNAAWSSAYQSGTITPNTTTAPDGTTTAATLTATGVTQWLLEQFMGTGISAAPYITTFYLKRKTGTGAIQITNNLEAGILTEVSGQLSTDNWTRVEHISTNSPVHLGVRIDVSGDELYFGGAQLEAGAFATSYISTVAATATRAADLASVTGASFSGFYNGAAGAFVTQAIGKSDAGNVILVNDNTANESIAIKWTDAAQGVVIDGGVTQATLDGGTLTDGTLSKIALAYEASNFGLSLDGATTATDTSGTLPAVDRIILGSGYNGHIKSLDYYSTRLPDATLVELTT